MDKAPVPAALRVRSVVEACQSYMEAKTALLDTLTDFGIGEADASVEDKIGCALVAEMLGGVPRIGRVSYVLAPDGKVVLVWSLVENFAYGFLTPPLIGVDEVALVAWVAQKPVAVHFVAADQLESMLEALTPLRFGRHHCIDQWLHCTITMEPLLAEVYGVRTVSVDLMAKAMCKAPASDGRDDREQSA